MLTLQLTLLLLSQTNNLGEAGESCRADGDCTAPLQCVAKVCSVRSTREEPPPVPARSLELASATPASPPEVSAEAVADERPSQFAGVHLAVGLSAGGAPGEIGALTGNLSARASQSFWARTTAIPVELKVALHLWRFEIAVEGSPGVTVVLGANVRRLFSAGLSLGGFIKVSEGESFGLVIPIRGRAGLLITDTAMTGGFIGATAGFGARFGRVLLEVRGGYERSFFYAAWMESIPVTAAATVVF